jgi:hypothetical protein
MHEAQVSDPACWSALNNLDTGICHGMTVDQVQETMPEEFARFEADPFHHRVTGGESYSDLVKRLESFVLHVERTTAPILIVSHMSVLQLLSGYFMDRPWDQIAKTPFPAGTVVQYTPNQYGWTEEVFRLDDTCDSSIPTGMPIAGGEGGEEEDGARCGHEREAELHSAGSFWSSGGAAGPYAQERYAGAAGPYAPDEGEQGNNQSGNEKGNGEGPPQGVEHRASSSGLQQVPARKGSRNLRRFSLGTL